MLLRNSLYVLTVFTVLLLPQVLISQTSEWRHFLAAGNVTSIADDGASLWFATSAGLVRRDRTTGEEEVFTKTNSTMPASDPRVLAVDHQDHLWAGFWGVGVAMYDGATWKVFNSGNSSLPNDFIQDLLFDRAGNLWAATWGGGVARFDGTSWSFFNNANASIPDDRIYRLALDSNGNVWCGTYHDAATQRGGLAEFDGTKWKIYRVQQELPFGLSITALAVDASGDLWAGTDNRFLYHHTGTTWKEFLLDETDPGTYYPLLPIQSILPGDSGIVYASTYSGLFRIVDTSVTRFTTANSKYPWTSITFFFHDLQGRLWIGGNTVAWLDRDEWHTMQFSTASILSNNISVLAEGNDGAIWAGWQATALTLPYRSLGRYNGSAWTFFNDSAIGIDSHHPLDFAFEKNGTMWYCGDTSVLEYDGSRWWQHLLDTTVAGVRFSKITRMAIDSMGNKWFTLYGGLAKYDGSNWTLYGQSNSGIQYGLTSDVTVAPDGTIWFATGGRGVGSFDGSSWKSYTTTEGLPTNKVNRIMADRRGNIWASTSSQDQFGLLKFDGQKWIVYDTSNSGLPGNGVNCMAEDHDGNLWVGTYAGVARFDGANWEVFTESNSYLSNNNITAILPDSKGNIWIGTAYGGISVYREGGLVLSSVDMRRFEQQEEEGISLSPNPTSSGVTISIPGNVMTVRIYDLEGRAMLDLSDRIRGNDKGEPVPLDVDLSGLANGTYFVEWFDGRRVRTHPITVIR